MSQKTKTKFRTFAMVTTGTLGGLLTGVYLGYTIYLLTWPRAGKAKDSAFHLLIESFTGHAPRETDPCAHLFSSCREQERAWN